MAVAARGQALSSLPTYTLSLVLSVAKLHTNAGCVLAYIPSLVGRASVWAAVLERGIREMHSEVTPYIMKTLKKSSLEVFISDLAIFKRLKEDISILIDIADSTREFFKLMFLFRFLQPSSSDNAAIKLDDFELLRVIGRGSYAKVLMVEQRRTKRIYAMKVIKKELVNDDEVRD